MKEEWESQEEEEIIKAARREADAIIQRAEATARSIYAYSLEYADDMLSEVRMMVLRAKEDMRQQSEAIQEEFDVRLNILEEHREEILDYLQKLSDNSRRSMKKASYDIKINEAFVPRKQSYKVKESHGDGQVTEVRKGSKQPYEIKVADKWKERVEEMLSLSEKAVEEKPLIQDEEGAEGFKAADFDLDAEYFSWLEGGKNSHPDE